MTRLRNNLLAGSERFNVPMQDASHVSAAVPYACCLVLTYSEHLGRYGSKGTRSTALQPQTVGGRFLSLHFSEVPHEQIRYRLQRGPLLGFDIQVCSSDLACLVLTI